MPAIMMEASQPHFILTFYSMGYCHVNPIVKCSLLLVAVGGDLFFPWTFPEANIFINSPLVVSDTEEPSMLLKNSAYSMLASSLQTFRLRFMLEEC